jgi:hypothetical protein
MIETDKKAQQVSLGEGASQPKEPWEVVDEIYQSVIE